MSKRTIPEVSDNEPKETTMTTVAETTEELTPESVEEQVAEDAVAEASIASDAEITLAEIQTLNGEVMQTEADLVDSKEETAKRKKLYEAAVSRLSARIARIPEPKAEVLPLIDFAEARASEWKIRPIDTLGLTESKNEKLIEAGITTLGELAAYIETANLKGGGVTWYADIPGIGQKVADEIEERLGEESTRLGEERRGVAAEIEIAKIVQKPVTYLEVTDAKTQDTIDSPGVAATDAGDCRGNGG